MDEREITETPLGESIPLGDSYECASIWTSFAYENGESPEEIYQSLGKSKAWFFKWLKRSRLDGEDWAKELSRRPHRTHRKIDKAMEQGVIEIRKHLEKELYAQIGAFDISWHLREQGINSPFIIVTINKILKRNDLVRKRIGYQPKGVSYPALEVTRSNHLYEFDVLDPRYFLP